MVCTIAHRFLFHQIKSLNFISVATTRRPSRLFFSTTTAASAVMEASSQSSPPPPCLLVLRGQSSAENEVAKSLKHNDTIQLPDAPNLSILLYTDDNARNLSQRGCFCFDSYMSSLSTNLFGRFVLWSPRLPSTHDVVSKNFCELPVGSVCVADIQYKGRGRSNNVWESPIGCLLFSFTMQMEDGRVVPLVQYVVSLAVTEAIKDVCDANGLPHLDVKIKWPNDLYLNGLKVGGILCTSTYKMKKFNVSAGIGLNIDNEKPTTCVNAVLGELSSRAYRLKREDILSSFFNKFEIFFNLLINQGFKTLEELYYRTWLHSGQKVTIQEENDSQLVETVVTVQGLTASGYLLAIGEDYQMYELHPDGNSFDFFKGLVRRKLD